MKEITDLLIDLTKKVDSLTDKIRGQVPDISLISENDAVKFLGVSKVTLNNWRNNNIFIKNKHYIRIGRSIRYKKDAIVNFNK